MKFDVVVIGGGPSGLMASASAGMHGAKVLLLDKGNKLGRKLAISGGGRCNVTNNKSLDELIRHIPGNGRFLHSVFATFNNKDIIHFFEDLGIALKEEDNGRMFPISNSAKDVVNALLQKVRSVHTTIQTDTAVKRVRYESGQVVGVESMNGEIWESKCVIIAAGGKSVPQTGSTGDGYAWAEAAGHTITELFPTEVPITSNETIITDKELQGLALRDVALSVTTPKGKTVITHRGDMIFTHFGLSGPIVLRCSQFVIQQQKKFSVLLIPLVIDLFPDQSLAEIDQQFRKLRKEHPKKIIYNLLKGWIPERLISVFCHQANTPPDLPATYLSNEQHINITNLMKHFQIMANGYFTVGKSICYWWWGTFKRSKS
jgi:predicted Rossmann fold flavoprotein